MLLCPKLRSILPLPGDTNIWSMAYAIFLLDVASPPRSDRSATEYQ
ncbi:hypothetical protein SAMN05444507_11117 [Pseudomonas syringae]|nr:hypothetical protein SAMN05444507_11117 [Pseudomonas syringae]